MGVKVSKPASVFENKSNDVFDVLIVSSFHNEIRESLLKYSNIAQVFSVF